MPPKLTRGKKGLLVWIFGFFTFFAALNSFNATFLWSQHGGNLIIQPGQESSYLQFITAMKVTTYFWVSILFTFLFLGVTFIIAYRGQPEEYTLPNTAQISYSLETYKENLIVLLTNLKNREFKLRSEQAKVMTRVSEELERQMQEISEIKVKLEKLESFLFSGTEK